MTAKPPGTPDHTQPNAGDPTQAENTTASPEAGQTQSVKSPQVRNGYRSASPGPRVTIKDLSKTSSNARVIQVDINKGNKQIAHGINRVLRPIDLPN